MKIKKFAVKFNIMDFLVFVFLLLIVVSSVIKGFAVKNPAFDITVSEVDVVIKIKDATDKEISKIEKGDEIYSKKLFGDGRTGKILEKSLREGQCTVKFRTTCVIESDGKFSINDEYIFPGMNFDAIISNMELNCEAVSVKKVK